MHVHSSLSPPVRPVRPSPVPRMLRLVRIVQPLFDVRSPGRWRSLTAMAKGSRRRISVRICRQVRVGQLHGDRESLQRQGMTTFTQLTLAPSDPPEPFTDRLRLAAAAYLARFKGSSREYTESDLCRYLAWCAEQGLDPLAALRPHLELYIRWMQEIRRFKPSTVSRRFSVVAGFYRTCVLDGVLEYSPAEHVRRPTVPAESPALGYTHLQFEALLTAARQSPNPYDFALVAMFGCWACGSSKATSADIADLGEEHSHRVLRVCGMGTKVVLVPLPPAVGRAIDRAIGSRTRGRSCSTAAAPGWTGTPRPAACASSPRPSASGSPGHTPICSVIRGLSVLAWRHEGRPNPGSARSCLTRIMYSVRHVQKDQDQASLLRCHVLASRTSRPSHAKTGLCQALCET